MRFELLGVIGACYVQETGVSGYGCFGFDDCSSTGDGAFGGYFGRAVRDEMSVWVMGGCLRMLARSFGEVFARF